MKYTLTNKPQKINETKGEIQNVSVRHVIVLAAGTSIPSVDTSTITVRPGESYPFKTVLGEVLYAWIINANDDETLEVSVINFLSEGEGGDTDISAIETEIINQGKQIQNCYVELGTDDNPLVYVISPKDGAIGASTQMSNQLSQGNGTCFSDGEGLDCVIDNEEDYMYVGEGYENIVNLENTTGRGDITITGTGIEEGWNYIEFEGTTTVGLSAKGILYLSEISGVNNGQYNFSIKFKTDSDLIKSPYCSYNGGASSRSTTNSDGFLYSAYIDDVGDADRLSFTFYAKNDNTVFSSGSRIYYKEAQITNTSEKVPYVQNSAPNGRMVIGEPWTSETHSIILIGGTIVPSIEDYKYVYICDENGSASSYECVKLGGLSSFEVGEKFDVCISKSVQESYNTSKNDLNTGVVTIDNKGISNGKIAFALPSMYKLRKNSTFEVIMIVEGDLTLDQMNEIREIVKSGKYIIPEKFKGTPHSIPYATKKADDNGLTYETIQTDTNRDLWSAEEDGFYEFIPKANSVPQYGYVELVDDVWTIPSFFTNVSGLLRVTELGKIRKVK